MGGSSEYGYNAEIASTAEQLGNYPDKATADRVTAEATADMYNRQRAAEDAERIASNRPSNTNFPPPDRDDTSSRSTTPAPVTQGGNGGKIGCLVAVVVVIVVVGAALTWGYNHQKAASNQIPASNTAVAGTVVPLHFGVEGATGLHILAAGYPKSAPVSCKTWKAGAGHPLTTLATTGPVRYSDDKKGYVLDWKTDKAWAGTCREIVIKYAQSVKGFAGGEVTMYARFT